jgi:CRISPR-associated protein Cas5h
MGNINSLLIFDIKGKIAHFRKFYTSSSSLTYTFPPRTTLSGLIAGILGRQRDSYYQEFSTKTCKIAISIKTPVRKIMQTINYIRTKEENGFTATKGIIKRFINKDINKYPTPLELVIPEKLTHELVYRVYFWHSDEDLIDELCARIEQGRFEYPLYLGISEALAYAEFITKLSQSDIKECLPDGTTRITTVCNTEHIAELEFSENTGDSLQYISEKMPVEFDIGRKIRKKAEFIHEKKDRYIKAKLKIPYLEISYDNEKENIIFME